MPIVPPAVGNPYPTVGFVMNVARARFNDMMNDVDGDLLTDDAPYAQTYLSSAWEWYQEKCAEIGVETLKRVVVLSGLPIRQSNDVADEAFVSWLGYSDGVFQYDSPALPQDLIQPLKVEQRSNGGTFNLMVQAPDGLSSWLNISEYDWREDGLYFYANTQVQDLRIRYAAYRASLDITQPDSLVPMMRCANPLGARIAYEAAHARGGAGTESLKTLADEEFGTGAGSRKSKLAQRQTIRRRPYSSARAPFFINPVH